MKRKLLTALIAVCLLLCLLPAAAMAFDFTDPLDSGICGDDLTWTLYRGYMTIEGTGDMYNYDIPNGVLPPWHAYEVSEVHLPKGITSIGDYAFYGQKKIIIMGGDTLKRIGAYAFSHISQGISNHLISVVESIGDYAYSDCPDLSYCYIGSTVRTIGAFAYANCPELDDVDMLEGVQHIGDNAFQGCTSLSEITFAATVKSVGSNLFYNADGKLRQITFLGDLPQFEPDTFATVSAWVYYPADNPTWTEEALTNYGGELTWIPYHGSALTDQGVCGDDIRWAYDANTKTLQLMGTGGMDGYGLVRLPDFPTSYIELTPPWKQQGLDIRHVVVGEGITSLSRECFKAFNVETLSLPSTIQEIGENAFAGTKLKEVTLPEGLHTIQNGAFYETQVTQVTFPYSLKSLGTNAFAGCTELKAVTFQGPIPGGNGAFSGLSMLIRYPDCFTDYPQSDWRFGGTFTYEAFHQGPRVTDTGKCGENVTWDLYDDGRLHIYGTGDMYDYSWENPAPWRSYNLLIDFIEIDEGITSIGAHAFEQSHLLGDSEDHTVTIPSTVTRVGEWVFDRLGSVQNVVFLGDMPQFDDNAFAEMDLFLYYPEGNETWTYDKMLPYGGDTFYLHKTDDGSRYGGLCGESARWSVDTASGVLTISGTGAMVDYRAYVGAPWSNWVIQNIFTVRSLVIEEGITRIGEYAFQDLAKLTHISFPDTLTEIGSRAFSGCNALTSITIPDAVTEFGWSAFSGCRGLESVYVGTGITAIPTEAFSGCPNLRTVLLPAGITGIGNGAFNSDGQLSTVVFLGSTEQWRGMPKGEWNEPLASTAVYCIDAPEGFVNTDNYCIAVTSQGRDVAYTVPVRTNILVLPGCGSVTLRAEGTGVEFRLVSSDGTTTPIQSAVKDDSGITVTLTDNCTVIVSPMHAFLDVSETAYYYPAVLWAVENNITKGKTENFFDPSGACTRKQVVTFLWRAAGCPEPASMENPFTDVTRGDQFEKAILWAYYEGITKGTSATEFSPESTCTRKQIVTFLWRWQGCPEPQSMEHPFVDVKQDQFEKAILWAYHADITTGKTAFTFQPEATCTRAQIVTFLYRAMVE